MRHYTTFSLHLEEGDEDCDIKCFEQDSAEVGKFLVLRIAEATIYPGSNHLIRIHKVIGDFLEASGDAFQEGNGQPMQDGVLRDQEGQPVAAKEPEDYF